MRLWCEILKSPLRLGVGEVRGCASLVASYAVD